MNVSTSDVIMKGSLLTHKSLQVLGMFKIIILLFIVVSGRPR